MARVGKAQREVSARWPDLKQAVSGDSTNPLTLDEQVIEMNCVYSSGLHWLENMLAEAMIPTAEEIAAAVPGTLAGLSSSYSRARVRS
jgi:hypothetical protein